MKLTHHALALLVVFIWGTNFVFIRVGLDELGPFTFATLRFVFVAFPLVFILPKPNTSWRNLGGYGVFIGAGQFGLLFWAMQSDISPGLASLIIQTQVFFTVTLAAFLFREKISKTQFFSLFICLSGLTLVMTFTGGSNSIFGITLVLIAALSWACANLIVKRAGKVDILAFIAWSSLFAIPPLALFAVINEGLIESINSAFNASLQTWLVVIWQSVGNTMIGYGLWNYLLSRHSTSSVVPWALMVPIFGMSASALLLDEPLLWWKLTAATLILVGLLLNMSDSKTTHKAKP